MRRRRLAVAGALVCVLSAGTATAALHIYSYEPSDAQTREASGPLTFEVRRSLIGAITILNLRSTVADASAELRRSDPKTLGPGGLKAVSGADPGERDLYEIEPADQGGALIAALCPGATRAWMAFSRIRFDQDLSIEIMGAKSGAPARICHRLAYDFHGEWKAPPSGVVLRERDILHGRYPGT